MVSATELPININASAMSMANTIFGDGTTVTGASYNGDYRSSGIWSDGDSVSDGFTPGDTGVILSTGRVYDVTNSRGDANQHTNTSTNTWGSNNIGSFNSAAGANTYDSAYLDVDFIPTHDTLTIRFVFSSEEYPEYASSIYNDFVGVWINGNYVDPVTEASVTGVNATDNSNLYVSNTHDEYNTEMDGFTVTMTLTIPVNAGETNSIRIGIADVSDSNYDSNLLIAGDSVQSTLVAIHDDVTMYVDGSTTIDPLANDINHTTGTLSITHINGIPVTAGSTVTLNSGQTVTLNADGTFTIDADSDAETVNFTYEIASTTGDIDVGIVTLNTVPCFVAGTMILTPEGERPVEGLSTGDLVMTVDDGPQPVRWIGQRRMRAEGRYAPIEIAPGTFGAHGRLRVSPLHRVLMRDGLAEMLFGSAEVLVAARDLVNGSTIRQISGGMVDYVHILFDRHQIVISNGVETESFLPGPQTSDAYEAEVLREICSIFPEFDPVTGDGYPPAARLSLKAYEARLYSARRSAA
ncbi:Hint domain-containing protein [Frigidibacter sp. ROC022]|uniref:Hint domain-containing protein n=1 Tax=Frigidibacter sp. ROC022 TaxID=2971796 RepID=UPI00215ADD3D|nr:Hint domain-containing protein [Frigidibacter sp. ROC022]MCR8724792.1 Hint domain-containing protein [Frigidibacter sp. ROC022]